MREIRKFTDEGYIQGLNTELKYFGLIDSVEKRLDTINDLLHYSKFSTRKAVQGQMIEILDLVKLREKGRTKWRML